MKKVKKFFIHAIPLVAAVTLVFVRIPDIDKWLKENDTNQTIVFSILSVCLVVNFFLTIRTPYTKLKEIRRRCWDNIAPDAQLFLDTYNAYDLNINIMEPHTEILYAIEPSRGIFRKKLRLYGKVFEMVWEKGKPRATPGLRFTVNQGNCGDAFKGNVPFSCAVLKPAAGATGTITVEHNLTKKQKEKTSDLVIVASHRIETENKGDNERRKPLGVLNITSRKDASRDLVNDSALNDKLSNNMFNLAKICAQNWVEL